MNDKYYTPSLEEFHLGFEYYFSSAYQEGVSPTEIEIDGRDGYEPKVFNYDIYNYSTEKDKSWKEVMESMLEHNQIKVKYLDRDDIESLGFKLVDLAHNGKSDILFGSDLIFNIETRGHIFQLILYGFNKPYTMLHISLKNEPRVTVFVGKIKNKSELKILLKQLGITDEL